MIKMSFVFYYIYTEANKNIAPVLINLLNIQNILNIQEQKTSRSLVRVCFDSK